MICLNFTKQVVGNKL